MLLPLLLLLLLGVYVCACVCSYVLTAGRLIAPVIERLGAVAGFDWCMEALTGVQQSGLASEVALAKAAWFLDHQAFGDAVTVLKVCHSSLVLLDSSSGSPAFSSDCCLLCCLHCHCTAMLLALQHATDLLTVQ